MFAQGRPRLPGEPVPQLRRVPLRVPVRAAARVRHQRAADAGANPAPSRTRTTPGRALAGCGVPRITASSTACSGLRAFTALLFALRPGTEPGRAVAPARWRLLRVVPHAVMVALFGSVGFAVLAALAIGGVRCWRDMEVSRARSLAERFARCETRSRCAICTPPAPTACPAEERRPRGAAGGTTAVLRLPALLCVHVCRGDVPRRRGSSALRLYQPAGRARDARRRRAAGRSGGALVAPPQARSLLADPAQSGLDDSFLALLFVTSLTGLVLLVLRAMR